jgi:integrase
MANKRVIPLSDTQIKNAKPSNKVWTLSDGNGLMLQIKPSGSKVWTIRYTLNGIARKTTAGNYPAVTLAEARKKRDALKEQVANSIDPIQERKNIKSKITAKILEDEALQEGQFHLVAYGWLNSLSIADNTRKKRVSSFERDIFPVFCTYDKYHKIVSSKHIKDISHSELFKILEKKKILAPVVANRRFTDCKSLWRYAINHGYTEINIVDKISNNAFNKHEEIHRPKITDEKILGELLRAMDIYLGEGGLIVRNVLRLTSLTMLRIGNLATLKWDNIDFDNDVITIKRSEMKVKDKNLPDFVLPLSYQAIKILKETKEVTGWGDWVFYGIKDNLTHVNKESGNKALRIMGFNEKEKGRQQRLHSFRGTYASLARTHNDKHGATFDTLERVLDHQESNKVARAYAHMADYTEQMRKLLQWWADFLDEVKNREQPSN